MKLPGLSRRVIWLICIGIAVLHLGFFFSIHLANAPGTFDVKGFIAGGDARTYLDAGYRQAAHQPLYDLGAWSTTFTYLYHPIFALVMSGLNPLGDRGVDVLLFLADAVAYVLALIVWPRALDRLGAHRLAHAVRDWQPLLLTFTAFYIEVYTVNVIGPLLLAAACATWLLAEERDWAAILVLTFIALSKPFWLFPLAIPVMAGQWRRTGKLILGVLVLYAAVTGFYVLVSGPAYGVQQVGDYLQLLKNSDQFFPWTGQGEAFHTYSLQQTLFYLLGLGKPVWILAGLVKLAFVAVLLICIRRLWRQKPSPETMVWGLFVAYLTAMLILSQVHEITFAAYIFVCLAASPDPQAKRWRWLYLPYAYLEVTALIGMSLGVWIDSVIPLLAASALLLWWACLRSLRASMLSEAANQDVTPAAAQQAAAFLEP